MPKYVISHITKFPKVAEMEALNKLGTSWTMFHHKPYGRIIDLTEEEALLFSLKHQYLLSVYNA